MVILQTPDVQRRNSEVYYEDMTELTTFGERVSWLLRRRRLADQPIASQKELAAHIGMKPQQLNAYMNGRRTPNVRHLRAIAAALETSVSYLALTTDEWGPDAVLDDTVEQVGISPEADEAAQLVDSMSDELRAIAVDLLRVLAIHDTEGDTEQGAPAPGTGGRLILSKLVSNLKKSSERVGTP